MPTPRSKQISLSQTPYYHCVSRCVRRAYLCGKDALTGKSFEHRRGWVEKRLLFLAQVFCIDVCAYAVMSNHTHLVLRVNLDEANTLSDEQVLIRWHRIFKGTLLSQQYMRIEDRQQLTPAEIRQVKSEVALYRKRLIDISWFMRCLNESIARQANREDECTGRFWEGRFKSQALLNERAVLACMAYVDLNPIRAGIASTLENSDYTSIKRRLCSRETKRLPFKGYMDTVFEEEGVSISLKEYEKLLLLSCSAIKSFGINKTLQLEFIKQVFDASELCIDHGKVTYGLQPNQLSNLNPYQDKAG